MGQSTHTTVDWVKAASRAYASPRGTRRAHTVNAAKRASLARCVGTLGQAPAKHSEAGPRHRRSRRRSDNVYWRAMTIFSRSLGSMRWSLSFAGVIWTH
jgi:hypothetical protein